MNNIVTNFDQILEFARQQHMPAKKRGIAREYLQAKFLTTLYAFPNSRQLSFVGGTSLRLLHDLDRFSEDLDFDNLGLAHEAVKILIQDVVESFRRENIDVEIKQTSKDKKNYFDLKFPKLLHELNITTNPKEKLRIKIDYSSSWREQNPETVLFTKYGFIEQIVTNKIEQMLVQKLTAYVQRKQTQPRDIYDVVWLVSRGVGLDKEFARANGLEDLVQIAIKKFQAEGVTRAMKRRLQPFLFKDTELRKLDFFADVLRGIK